MDGDTELGREGDAEEAPKPKRKRARAGEKRNGDPSASHRPRDIPPERRISSSEGTVYSDFAETIPLIAGTPEPDEPIAAIKACNDFIRLGRTRSKTRLMDWYRDNPTLAAASWSQICTWYVRFSWMVRGNLYDMEVERALTARQQEVFGQGLATIHERVLELQRIYLEVKPRLIKIPQSEETQYTYSDEKGWVDENGNPPPKDTPVNTDVLQQMRGLLDDLALETGGRTKTLALFAKRDPAQALFDMLQNVAPELPSGEPDRETEVIEADYTIETIPRADEGTDAIELLGEHHDNEDHRPGGGGDLVPGANGEHCSGANEPDQTGGTCEG